MVSLTNFIMRCIPFSHFTYKEHADLGMSGRSLNPAGNSDLCFSKAQALGPPGTGLASQHSLSSNSPHWTPSLPTFRVRLFLQWKVLSPGISSGKRLDSVTSVKREESSSSFLPRKEKRAAEDWGNKDPISPREDTV